MKKLFQILSSAIISVACMGSLAAYADPASGTITLTGPGSNNTFTDNENNTYTFTCNNTVPVTTTNTQTGVSGSGTVSVNTNGGTAQSGQAFNVNGTNVTVGASCNCTEQLFSAAAVCPTAAAVTPGAGALEAPGGGGAGAAELPNTAGAQTATIAAGSLVVLGVMAAASRLAVTAYRRFAIK